MTLREIRQQLEQLTEPELMLARQHLLGCAKQLQENKELPKR